MIDHLYINSVATLIIVALIIIFFISNSKRSENKLHANYAKHNGAIISMPKHVLNSLIAKYKHKLIHTSNAPLSPTQINKLREIELILAKFVQIKYKIKFNPQPYDIEKNLLDYKSKNNMEYDYAVVRCAGDVVYDEEIIGEDHAACNIGKIIWYLEQIVLMDNRNSSHVEIPLQLDHIKEFIQDSARTVQDPMRMTDFESIAIANNMADNAGINDTNINNVSADIAVDSVANNFPGKLRPKFAPKKCSTLMRDNLDNFISDMAIQELQEPYPSNVSDEDNQKARNYKEAAAMWKNTNIYRLSDQSHSRDADFADSNNKLEGTIYPSVNTLAFDIAKSNRSASNTKQTLTDKWDYLEHKFLTGY